MLENARIYLPAPQKAKWLLGSYSLYAMNGFIYKASLGPISNFLAKLVKASLTKDEAILKILLDDRKSMAILGGVLVSLSIISNIHAIVRERIKLLYEQEFYLDMAKDGRLVALTLYNDFNNESLKCDLQQLSKSYVNVCSAFQNDAIGLWLFYYGAQALYTYFWHSRAIENISLFKSVISVVTLSSKITLAIIPFTILFSWIPAYVGLKEQVVATANLNEVKALLSENTLTHMGATGIALKAFNNAFENYWKASSPMTLRNLSCAACGVVANILNNIQKPIVYIAAANAGYDSVMMSLSESLFTFLPTIEAKTVAEDIAKLEQYKRYVETIKPLKTMDTTEEMKLSKTALSLEGGVVKMVPGEGELAWIAKTIDGKPIAFKYGEITIIRGKSGTGKTTLAEVITGYSNRFRTRDFDQSNDADAKIYKDIELTKKGMVQYIPSTQHKLRVNISIFEFLTADLDVTNKDVTTKSINEYLRKTQLDSVIEDLNAQMPENLSNGEMKRLLLVKGMVQGAKLIVLDETLASVTDNKFYNYSENTHISERGVIMNLIKEYAEAKQAAVVCISHETDQNLPDFASNTIEFRKGFGLRATITQKAREDDNARTR